MQGLVKALKVCVEEWYVVTQHVMPEAEGRQTQGLAALLEIFLAPTFCTLPGLVPEWHTGSNGARLPRKGGPVARSLCGGNVGFDGLRKTNPVPRPTPWNPVVPAESVALEACLVRNAEQHLKFHAITYDSAKTLHSVVCVTRTVCRYNTFVAVQVGFVEDFAEALVQRGGA